MTTPPAPAPAPTPTHGTGPGRAQTGIPRPGPARTTRPDQSTGAQQALAHQEFPS
ncbi:hypothetical protein GTY65_26465 [Streptomyces sp. SID8379]|uniref:hypothetical protein n=1 Tax=unclassified Streptomyces TaxID=2593676 RepID=UPI00039D8810|nr:MULTISPECIES: hypothetical protein [unclassified Streptomyces]MYW67587.1 hypothetical protein [Streptomyces sp. SID8379]